jgi:hypothetical protein
MITWFGVVAFVFVAQVQGGGAVENRSRAGEQRELFFQSALLHAPAIKHAVEQEEVGDVVPLAPSGGDGADAAPDAVHLNHLTIGQGLQQLGRRSRPHACQPSRRGRDRGHDDVLNSVISRHPRHNLGDATLGIVAGGRDQPNVMPGQRLAGSQPDRDHRRAAVFGVEGADDVGDLHGHGQPSHRPRVAPVTGESQMYSKEWPEQSGSRSLAGDAKAVPQLSSQQCMQMHAECAFVRHVW